MGLVSLRSWFLVSVSLSLLVLDSVTARRSLPLLLVTELILHRIWSWFALSSGCSRYCCYCPTALHVTLLLMVWCWLGSGFRSSSVGLGSASGLQSYVVWLVRLLWLVVLSWLSVVELALGCGFLLVSGAIGILLLASAFWAVSSRGFGALLVLLLVPASCSC